MLDAVRTLHDAVENREVLRRVHTMRENGVLYGDLPERYAGNPKEDVRFEKTYAEFNVAAYGLAAAGFSDLDFRRRESPDFEVYFNSGLIAYLEIVGVKDDDEATYDGLLLQMNVALNKRASVDKQFAAKISSVFCEIVLPSPPRKSEREAVVSEVVDLLSNEDLSVDEPQMVKIGERYPLLCASGAQYIVVPAQGVSHLSFRKPPQSFDAFPVANTILVRIAQKRIAGAKYEGSPLWLMAHCGVPGTEGALMILRDIDIIEISPYERVFVGDQRRILELRNTLRP